MSPSDKPSFGKALADLMAGYGKPLPDAGQIGTWFKLLEPFKPGVIARAFADYVQERPDFAPVPNSIVARCRLLDGRPEENEAWALALSSRDERETVVWTSEMSEAFRVAQPLLAAGDEIGARMAFKDAYPRLVAASRAANLPAVWSVSAGWDAQRRTLAVQAATRSGLLEGPQAHLALPDESGLPPARPEGLARVLEALAALENPLDKAERHREARIAAEEAADRERKKEISRQVRDYLSRDGEQ